MLLTFTPRFTNFTKHQQLIVNDWNHEEDVEKMQDDAKKNQERIDQSMEDEEPQEEVEVEPDLVISEDTIIKELESEVKLKELEVLDSINKSLKK